MSLGRGQTEEPLCPPSTYLTDRDLQIETELRGPYLCSLNKYLGLYLLKISVRGKLRQLFPLPQKASFPLTWDLSSVPRILFPHRPFMLTLAILPLPVTPFSHLGVREDGNKLQSQSGANSVGPRSRGMAQGPPIHMPADCQSSGPSSQAAIRHRKCSKKEESQDSRSLSI